jgi:peptide methionine sulfoxide reductase MsrB
MERKAYSLKRVSVRSRNKRETLGHVFPYMFISEQKLTYLGKTRSEVYNV